MCNFTIYINYHRFLTIKFRIKYRYFGQNTFQISFVLNLTLVILSKFAAKNGSFSYPIQTKFLPKLSVIELLAKSLTDNKEKKRI